MSVVIGNLNFFCMFLNVYDCIYLKLNTKRHKVVRPCSQVARCSLCLIMSLNTLIEQILLSEQQLNEQTEQIKEGMFYLFL